MRGIELRRDPRIDGDLQRPEIIIRPRFDIAADLGVTTSALSQTIRIATIGDIEQNLAKFSLTDRQIPIRVSIEDSERKSLSVIENLPVPTPSGRSVTPKAVADVCYRTGPSDLRRYNQVRRVVIAAGLAPRARHGDAH